MIVKLNSNNNKLKTDTKNISRYLAIAIIMTMVNVSKSIVTVVGGKY